MFIAFKSALVWLNLSKTVGDFVLISYIDKKGINKCLILVGRDRG